MSGAPTSFRPYARMGWGGRAASHFRGAVRGAGDGTVVYRSPGGWANWEIVGVSRNSAGVALASCVIELFESGSDLVIARTVSAANGAFTLSNPGTGPFYLVAYKAGSPDVAGTTVNTILPTAFVYPVVSGSSIYYVEGYIDPAYIV